MIDLDRQGEIELLLRNQCSEDYVWSQGIFWGFFGHISYAIVKINAKLQEKKVCTILDLGPLGSLHLM